MAREGVNGSVTLTTTARATVTVTGYHLSRPHAGSAADLLDDALDTPRERARFIAPGRRISGAASRWSSCPTNAGSAEVRAAGAFSTVAVSSTWPSGMRCLRSPKSTWGRTLTSPAPSEGLTQPDLQEPPAHTVAIPPMAARSSDPTVVQAQVQLDLGQPTLTIPNSDARSESRACV